MKRVLFIIWMLALVIHLQQAAHAENTALFSDDFAGGIQSIVNSDEGIVVLGEKGLFLWRSDTNLQEQILHREKLPSSGDLSLVLWQGKPFLLDQWTGQLYQVADGQAYLAYAIPEDVFQYEDQGEMTTKQIIRCVTAGDRLFLLLGSFTFEQGDVKELYALESDLQTLTRLSSQEIQALWSAAGEQLLVEEILDGANRLCLYDPQTQNNLRVWNELDTQEKAGFVWDEEEKTLYYTGDSGKVYALAEDGSIILCAYLPFKFQYTSDSAFLYHQQTYAYLHSGMFFMRELQRDGASVVTLNIMGMPDEQMIARFSAEYPEISINLQNRTEDIQALQRAIILSDGSVDLYLVASDGIYSDVIEKGYAMTLEASEALRGYAERFYPWVRDVIIKDDQLLALPASISIDHWTMNQTKWNELALGDRPKTLEQLFRLADRWQADYAQDNEDWCLFDCLDGLEGVMQDMVRQYLLEHETWEQPVSFDTEEFRNAAAAAWEYRDAFQSSGEQQALLMNYPQYFGTGYNDEDLVVSTLPVRLSEESPYRVRGTMDLWILSPASLHQKEALLFLQYAMEHMDTETRYRIDSGRNQPVRLSSYAQRIEEVQQEAEELRQRLAHTEDEAERMMLEDTFFQIELRLERLEETSWEISEADIAIYKEIAPYVTIPLRTIYPKDSSTVTQTLDQVISRFASGQLPLDRFIKELDEKSLMIFAEMK